MWKITCNAIAEQPWGGHGIGYFAAAYGDAQENYFAAGNYEPWEERVAGSPEYAFNEYLQAAVELGVPLTLCLLAVVMACLRAGFQERTVWNLRCHSFVDGFLLFVLSVATSCIHGNFRRTVAGLRFRGQSQGMAGLGSIGGNRRWSPSG